MRIAIISDSHGNLPALESVVKDIGRRGANAVVNLGNSLSGPLLPLETAQFLIAHGCCTLQETMSASCSRKFPAKEAPSDIFMGSGLEVGNLKKSGVFSP